jgi:cell division protein FtsQ
MWLGIGAYVVLASLYGRERRAQVRVGSLKIAIVDTADIRVVTTEKVQGWLSRAAVDPFGRPIDSVDTRAIETLLAGHPEVKHVSVWTDLEGTLTVRIEPRKPALRVRADGGYRFWYTDDGYIIPDRGDFAAYVPVVTGRIPFPFPPTASGSYAGMQAAAWNDYFARFTALDKERRELETQTNALGAQIRTIRQSTPKRWWSQNRRQTFTQGKAARIAELEKQRAEHTSALRKIGRLEAELREKEKKSQQSLRFLSKLANFVEFIGADDFWSAQIVQINIEGESGPPGSRVDRGERDGSQMYCEGSWREPWVELIPRAGNHTVLLGELDGTERQRLENLRLFYLGGLWHQGWDAYTGIDIRYRNQIVCTK